MVIIKIIEATPKKQREEIRRYYDEKNQKWYFSIVDVIGVMTDSSDPRNYWKVLKNRLKKGQSKLVTKCNQLKMKANDGKFYLTDVGDDETIIEIIESIPKASVEAFKVLMNDIKEGRLTTPTPEALDIEERVENEIELGSEALGRSTTTGEAKLLIDAYETETSIFIQAMVAGVKPENISIRVENKKIIIEGKRERGSPEQRSAEKAEIVDYLHEELYWLNFSRAIKLPALIQKDKVKVTHERGVLTIELEKKI